MTGRSRVFERKRYVLDLRGFKVRSYSLSDHMRASIACVIAVFVAVSAAAGVGAYDPQPPQYVLNAPNGEDCSAVCKNGSPVEVAKCKHFFEPH